MRKTCVTPLLVREIWGVVLLLFKFRKRRRRESEFFFFLSEERKKLNKLKTPFKTHRRRQRLEFNPRARPGGCVPGADEVVGDLWIDNRK